MVFYLKKTRYEPKIEFIDISNKQTNQNLKRIKKEDDSNENNVATGWLKSPESEMDSVHFSIKNCRGFRKA